MQTLSLGTLVTLNLAFGMLAQGLVVVLLGPGGDTDALFASLTLPQLLLLVTSGPAARVLVPVFSESDDAAALQRDAWTVVHVVGAAVGGLALLLGAAASLWVPLLFPGFPPATRALTTTLTRIQLLAVVFTATTTVLAAFHQSQRRFLRVEAALLCGTALTAAIIAVGVSRIGVAGVAWVAAGQAALQTSLLMRGLGTYRRPDWSSAAASALRRRVLPLVAGALVYKNERTVDRLLASYASGGHLSLLALGYQAWTSAGALLHRVITVPLVPTLTRCYGARDYRTFRTTYRTGAVTLLVLTAAACGVVAVGGRLILPLLAGAGQMTRADLETLWNIMLALSGYVIAGGCGQVVSAAFYAQGDTLTPTRVGIAAFLGSIPLRAIGFSLAGVPGIAMGSSAYHLLNAAILLGILETRTGRGIGASDADLDPASLPSWRAGS